MSASMCRMQQPSAPNAVAIRSRGWNRSTAHRSTSNGLAPVRWSLAAVISSAVIWVIIDSGPTDEFRQIPYRHPNHYPASRKGEDSIRGTKKPPEAGVFQGRRDAPPPGDAGASGAGGVDECGDCTPTRPAA